MKILISALMMGFSFNVFAAAPTKTLGYGGAAWAGSCTNLTTGGAQTSQMTFDVTAYPTVKLGINGANFQLQVGTKSNVTLPSNIVVGVLLELSSSNDFIFHTYNQAPLSAGSQEQQMSFTLTDTSHLVMRQDSWIYQGGATVSGDSYYCKYTR